MIKTLSYTEAQKFHRELVQRMLEELRNSDSDQSGTPVEHIDWLYDFETVDEQVDIRRRSKDIDRAIRREKLLKLDDKLRNKREKTNIFVSFFTTASKKTGNEIIEEEINDFFDKIVAISLVIKVGDYERFENVEKTSLFESRIKEKMGVLTF